jgi:hypothetical protein
VKNELLEEESKVSDVAREKDAAVMSALCRRLRGAIRMPQPGGISGCGVPRTHEVGVTALLEVRIEDRFAGPHRPLPLREPERNAGPE